MRVYLAGPISKGWLISNIRQASQAFHDLAKLGHSPMCPHWSCFGNPHGLFGDQDGNGLVSVASVDGGGLAHADWMRIDLDWLAHGAEAVLRLPGESPGADMEVEAAKKAGIPVYYSIADIPGVPS